MTKRWYRHLAVVAMGLVLVGSAREAGDVN